MLRFLMVLGLTLLLMVFCTTPAPADDFTLPDNDLLNCCGGGGTSAMRSRGMMMMSAPVMFSQGYTNQLLPQQQQVQVERQVIQPSPLVRREVIQQAPVVRETVVEQPPVTIERQVVQNAPTVMYTPMPAMGMYGMGMMAPSYSMSRSMSMMGYGSGMMMEARRGRGGIFGLGILGRR